MNTPSNAVSASARESQMNDSRVVSPAAISPTQRLYWSVRRELWEYRSIYIAPLAAATLFLFAFLVSTIRLPGKMRAAMALDPMQQHRLIAQPYNFAAGLIMAIGFVVAVFYSLDALHGERRDRSILFWKSLPVSDLTTVLSKASIPIVVIPLLTFVITLAMQWIMLVLSTVVLLGNRASIATLWTQLSWFQMSMALLYHLVAIHALWYAPIWCWLLLVSGWARRAAFLWAFLPLLVIGVLEKIAFNTSHFAALLQYRMGDSVAGLAYTEGIVSMDPLMQLTPGKFLLTPGLWIGLAVAAAFLFAAVRLRRSRGPI
ncbi:MAG: ABC transporter permease [Terriglobales bacterium]